MNTRLLLSLGILAVIAVLLLPKPWTTPEEVEVSLPAFASRVEPVSFAAPTTVPARNDAGEIAAPARTGYDPDAVETLRGIVVDAHALPPTARRFRGGMFRLDTSEGVVAVRVPAAPYIHRDNFEIDMDDELEVIGNPIQIPGEPAALLAAQIGKGERILKLRPYDPDTAETFSGTVVAVRRKLRPGGSRFLTVQTDTQLVWVQVGPRGYLEEQGSIEADDQVEITGAPHDLGKNTILLAAEVKSGDQVYRLRDGDGVPLWTNWRRKRHAAAR